MLRFLFRLTVLGAVAAGGAYLLGYRWDDAAGGRVRAVRAEAGAAAAELADRIDRERIRETGTVIAGTIRDQTSRAEAALGDARITTKIKAKLALDDTLDELQIGVDTEKTVVTVRGRVADRRQRDRVLQLARETEGVTAVVDRLDAAEP
jgi:osmotically-inducible protein OsmY